MRICYLNHDARSDTGAGRFFNSFSMAVKKLIPDVELDVLTSEDLLFPNKFKLLLALPAIRKVIKNCDIVHTLDGWPYGVVAALASMGLKKKLIITAIGSGAVKPLYQPLKSWLLKWAYKKADRVVAVSHNTKKEIQKFLPDLKIEVINHGVDYEKFHSENMKTHESTKIKNLQPYILSVGAWKPRKGFEYSLKSFEKIKNKFPDLKYVIASRAPEEVKKKYDRVVFLENLSEEDLINLYKNAELFILLPQDANKDVEGFGLVFLEAAACGLPVIATQGTSAEDAVRDGKNGVLVPPRDSLAAAAAIEKILKNRNLKDSFSRESAEFAKEMSWGKVAAQYREIYNRV